METYTITQVSNQIFNLHTPRFDFGVEPSIPVSKSPWPSYDGEKHCLKEAIADPQARLTTNHFVKVFC